MRPNSPFHNPQDLQQSCIPLSLRDLGDFVKSFFPLVKFWNRQAWKIHEGEKKNLGGKSGQQGGGRSAKGENVMMQFIENSDGTPITGNLVVEIRAHAQSIWLGLHEKDNALEKWGNATKDVRKQYYYEMESEFYLLCLCDNHWKSQAITTTIYSQWRRHVSKSLTDIKCEEDNDFDFDNDEGGEGNGSDKERPPKRLRSVTYSPAMDPGATSKPKSIAPGDPLF